jgi:hypothetical protein
MMARSLKAPAWARVIPQAPRTSGKPLSYPSYIAWIDVHSASVVGSIDAFLSRVYPIIPDPLAATSLRTRISSWAPSRRTSRSKRLHRTRHHLNLRMARAWRWMKTLMVDWRTCNQNQTRRKQVGRAFESYWTEPAFHHSRS